MSDKSVWLVSSGSYSDYRVHCAAPSKRGAREIVAALNGVDRIEYFVEQVPVVEKAERITVYGIKAVITDDGTVREETQMSITTDLRAALEAALPDLTEEQADAARALIGAPAMEEPKWPGAPVIAGCYAVEVPSLHTRLSWCDWECVYCTSIPWHKLDNPRPLTPAEYEKYGIPAPCTHGAQDFCGVGQ